MGLAAFWLYLRRVTGMISDFMTGILDPAADG